VNQKSVLFEESNSSFAPANLKIKLVVIGLAGLLLRGTVTDFAHILIGQNQIVETMIDIIAIAMFVVGLFEVIRNFGRVVFFSLIIFAIIWGYSYLFFPENREYISKEYIQFFIYSLPFLWFGYYLIKSNQFIDLIIPIAKIKLILALIVQIAILLKLAPDLFEGDYQTAAYSLIFGLTAIYYKSVRDKKLFDIVLAIVGTVVLLLVGSRSILVSIFFFWLVFFLITVRQKKSSLIIIIVVLLLVWVGMDAFISGLSSASAQVGYSNHISDALSDSALFVDENRTALYAGFFSLIMQSPFGYGVMGDRYLSYSTGLFFKPIYPHNIFLEIGVDFGYVVGTLLIVLLLVYIIKSFVKQSVRLQMTMLVLLSSTFIKLIFASTFWGDQLFFLLIGCLLAINKPTKKYKNR